LNPASSTAFLIDYKPDMMILRAELDHPPAAEPVDIAGRQDVFSFQVFEKFGRLLPLR